MTHKLGKKGGKKYQRLRNGMVVRTTTLDRWAREAHEYRLTVAEEPLREQGITWIVRSYVNKRRAARSARNRQARIDRAGQEHRVQSEARDRNWFGRARR